MKARIVGRIMGRPVDLEKKRVKGGVEGHAQHNRLATAPLDIAGCKTGQRRKVATPCLPPVSRCRESVSSPTPSPNAIVIDNERSAFRSKLEEAYSRYLHGLLLAGDIRHYRYEPIRFNLAPNTTITPDFQVVLRDGTMEFHEVKGWAREDAMAKLKICARLYPEWKFWLVQRKRSVWDLRELPV